jgi:hypothetical protein
MLYIVAAMKKLQRDDKLTFENKDGQNLYLRVEAVRNPMMQYRYLVVWCKPDMRSP